MEKSMKSFWLKIQKEIRIKCLMFHILWIPDIK